MIGYLKGNLTEIYEDWVIVETGNVGFRVFVPATVLSGGYSIGDDIKLYTYLSVKEDALTLFGFATRDELECYKLLLGVSGVGPKAAMAIISTLGADGLRLAVLTDDPARIAKAPGVGKKGAQKVILELKDKFDLEDVLEPKEEAGIPVSLSDEGVSDAVQALAALGYSNADALKAVKKAAEKTGEKDSEALLKEALRFLF